MPSCRGSSGIEPMVSYVSYITGRLFTTSATCDHMQMQLINYMPSFHTTGFRSGSVVKNLPAWQETLERRVWSLRQEDPLGEEMATHSSILAGKNPMDRGAWRATVHGNAKNQTRLSKWAQQQLFTLCTLFSTLLLSLNVFCRLRGILMYSFHSLYNYFAADGVRLISYLLL